METSNVTNKINGMLQGADGFSQGGVGSFVGTATGPSTGINRAATGGPNMDQGTRQSQGFLSFLGNALSAVAPIASVIPGVGSLVGAGASMLGGVLGGIGGQQQLNQANAANQAATQNQANIASELASGPQMAPLIKAEQSGISSAVDNANTANPGRTLLDGLGQTFTNAISGIAGNRQSALGAASNIYGGIGTNATNAATAIGNPWTSAATAVQSGVNALKGNTGSGGTTTPLNPYASLTPTQQQTAGSATSSGALGTFNVGGAINNTPASTSNLLQPMSSAQFTGNALQKKQGS